MNTIFINPLQLDGNKVSYDYVYNNYLAYKMMEDYDTQTLEQIACEITDGTRVKRDFVEVGGYKFIGPSDIKDGVIYFNRLKYIKPEGIKDKDFVEEGDILITSVGRSGQVAGIPEGVDGCVISSDVIKIRLKNKGYSTGLYKFLKSDAGQTQMEAMKLGNVNRILVEDIKNIKIPRSMQSEFFNIGHSLSSQNEAYKLYRECLAIFNKALEYEDHSDKLKTIFNIAANDIQSDRWDVEHYIYLSTNLMDVIYTNTDKVIWQDLGSLVEIKRAVKPEISPEKEVEYFQLNDIDADLSVIKKHSKGEYGELSNRIRYIVNENELVTARLGSATGTRGHISAVITGKYSGMLTTDAFFNIVPVNINPYYLLFLFKQPVMLNQIDMYAKGSIFKMFQREDAERLRVPRVGQELESQIAENMRRYVSVYEKM